MRYLKSVGVLAVTAALTLTACGDDDEDSTASPSAPPSTSTSAASSQHDTHNSADIAFLQGMIPHHQQAVEMSQLAETRAASDQVKALARQIDAAQEPEIQTMTVLLQQFGAVVPAAEDHADMGHGGTDHGGMSGMMSASQMQQLEAATGADYDRLFLQMMIEHHRGAITMSQTELRDGQSVEARQLAQQIIDAQQQEITTMTGLLSGS